MAYAWCSTMEQDSLHQSDTSHRGCEPRSNAAPNLEALDVFGRQHFPTRTAHPPQRTLGRNARSIRQHSVGGYAWSLGHRSLGGNEGSEIELLAGIREASEIELLAGMRGVSEVELWAGMVGMRGSSETELVDGIRGSSGTLLSAGMAGAYESGIIDGGLSCLKPTSADGWSSTSQIGRVGVVVVVGVSGLGQCCSTTVGDWRSIGAGSACGDAMSSSEPGSWVEDASDSESPGEPI
eukprot:1368057-Rhodomonas_salina.3